MADDTKFAPSRNIAQLRDDLVWVATVATGGLRRSMARTGVRQIKDFVNGMVAAGVLLEKSYGDVTGGSFAEHFETCAAEARRHVMSGKFAEDLEVIKEHHIGIADQSPFDMLMTTGLSAKATVKILAREKRFSSSEALQIVCIAIVAAQVAEKEMSEDEVPILVEAIKRKARIWEEVVSSAGDQLGLDDDWDD
ncbi:MAG: hypothetical protein GYB53_24800 [Rhodobacteraceae bacterium]|nr:hypothetical protein [Paracoccaceae bacterium]MBR9823805.1 hypothetical protein [Paracoccaceae bacterium]